MSDYTDLFTSFYNQFILRDLLSIILPGYIIIIAALYSNFQTEIIIDFLSDDLSIIIVFIIVGISYVLGILLLLLGDKTGLCSTYYTTTPTDMRKRHIKFHRTLCLAYHEKENIFANIRERYIIFMQTSGNMAWASVISLFIVLFSYVIHSLIHQPVNNFGYNQIFLMISFLVIATFFGICNRHFKEYLEDWDSLIIDQQYQ